MEIFMMRRGGSGGGTGDAFAAISVTYPVGSICTCSNGSTTLTAKDTSGSYLFVLPSIGTWTVSVTGYGSKTVSVMATEVYSVAFDKLYLYRNGDTCDSVTGGWGYYTDTGGAVEFLADSIHLYNTGSSKRDSGIGTQKEINFSGFTALKARFKLNQIVSTNNNPDYGLFFGITDVSNPPLFYGDIEWVSVYRATYPTAAKEYTVSIDLTKIGGTIQKAVNFSQAVSDLKIYEIWLEA